MQLTPFIVFILIFLASCSTTENNEKKEGNRNPTSFEQFGGSFIR